MTRGKSLARTILEPIAIAIVLAILVRVAVKFYSIPSASMTPVLEVGDYVLVTAYFRGSPQRGDVVVFRSLSNDDELAVKRVVGVPGDVLDSRLGRVRVAGRTLPEPYLLRQGASGAIAPVAIPAGSYFVLGDNRDVSLDSRSWGLLSRERIVGRARLVVWSSGSVAGDQPARAKSRTGDAARRAQQGGRRLFKWIE